MSYIHRPFGRPRWFSPLLVAWVLTGMPVAIVMPYFWATGTSPTGTPPPASGPGEFGFALMLQLLAAVYVYGSPIFLAVTERNYRQRLQKSEGMR